MEFGLESMAKDYNNQWVCDEVSDAVIQNDKLYIKFIATVTLNLNTVPNYFNNHIHDVVSCHFSTAAILKKNNKIYIFCSPIHKELTKLAEMALDLCAEFRQLGTNKKSAEFSRKIVAENSANNNLSFLSVKMHMCSFSDNIKTSPACL